MEERPASTTWPVYSPFAREHLDRRRADGLAGRLAEIRAEAKAEGLTERYVERFVAGFVAGFVEGFVEGLQEGLLIMLDARGMDVTQPVRERIVRCDDTDVLETWIRRAAVIEKIEDLFD